MKNNNEFDNIIILNDEDGNEVKFEFLDLVEYKGAEYVVLLPCDEPDDGEVVILRVDESDSDEDSYMGVSDDDELNGVFAVFKDKFKDYFKFTD